MPAPQTPFELGGRIDWTPLEDEQAYVDSLLAYAGGRLRYEVAGLSARGNPLRLFQIGTGPRYVLFTSLIHGNEPASREVMYTMLRRWLDSTDPDLAAYLQQVTVLVMPTCSPDSMANRHNMDGINVNRDFVALRAHETRVITDVMRRFRPELVVDWHEFHSTYADYSPSASRNANANPALQALGEDLFTAAHTAILAEGWTSRAYDIEFGPDWHLNSALVQGSVSVLMETSTMVAPAQRHDMHLHSTETIWRWHADHLDEVHNAVAAARAAEPSRTDPIALQMLMDTDPPTVDPVPAGYVLSVAEWQRIETHRRLWGLTGRQAASGYYVPTAQGQRTLIAYLLDPESSVRVVEGARADAVPVSPPPVPIGRNVSYFFRHNGRTRPATLKVKP